MDTAAKKPEDIFATLNYYEAGTLTSQAKEILTKSAAKKHLYMSDMVKIAITDTSENSDDLSEISDIYDIPVVSCSWVTQSYLCGKLLPHKPFPPKQIAALLFTGKVFCASGLSKTDSYSLWSMMTFYGGKCQRKLTDEVTHLVTTSTSRAKVLTSHKYPEVHIVTPDWIVECIKEDKIVDEGKYHPKLVLTSPALRKQLQHMNTPEHINAKSMAPMSVNSKTPLNPVMQPHLMHPSESFNVMPTTPVSNADPTSNQLMMPRIRTPTRYNLIPNSGDRGAGYSPAVGMPPYMINRFPHGQMRAVPPHHQSSYMQQTLGVNYPNASYNRLPGNRQMTPSKGHMPVSAHMFAPMNQTAVGRQAANQSPKAMTATSANQHMSSLNDTNTIKSTTSNSQRVSPINQKTPPAMNLGQMNEVPYPSQASLPEETPIIRMTNMAAFPMGADQKKGMQAQPGRPEEATGMISNASNQNSMPRSSPASISVIKPTKPAVPETKDRSPGKAATPAQPIVGTGSTGGNSMGGTSAMTDTHSHVYYGYDSAETVPKDMCLIGCIFYMGDYVKLDPELCEDWIKAIEQNGGTVDPSYSNRVTHVLVETQASDVCRLALNDHKRVVTAHWLNDVIGKGQMEPPWRAHHLPHPHSPDKQLCANQVIGITGFNRKERIVLQTLIKMIGASYTSYLARSNTALICKRLEGVKVDKAKEWGIVCVNVQWLSELVLGNLRALKLPIADQYMTFGTKSDDFSIDPNMAPLVMSGWRVPLKIPKDCWRKFKPSNKSVDASADSKRKSEEESLGNPTKRIRLQEIQNTRSNMPLGQPPVVMLTGFTKVEKAKYSEMIERLGGIVSDDASKCSHLIAEKIVRTPNFLRSVNYCLYITSAEWIIESVKSNHFVDERVFTLQNTEAGSMWNILEALERRRTHGRPFVNLMFHITPGVPTATRLPRKFLCELISAAGGVVQSSEEKRWSARRITEMQKMTHNNKLSYIVITCKDDVHLCMDLLNANIDVFSVEFILSGVMNQQTSYDTVLCSRNTE